MKYEAVLFDLGNVVQRVHFDRTFESWANACGKRSSEISALFTHDEAYCAHETAQITSQQYHQHICKLIGAQLTYEQFVSGWIAMLGEVIAETESLLRELKGHYRLFALTNSNALHRQVWSKRYEHVLKNFERVFCSSEIHFRKPEHNAFEAVCRITDIPKDRFVFIDDLAANINAAEKFGFKTFLFSDPQIVTSQIRRALLG